MENPVERVLREGIIVGLANHTVLIAKDGAEFPIDDSGAPIRNDQGDITGVVLIFRDVTKKRQAEVALKEYSERLEEMVEERTKKLKAAQEQLIRKEKLSVLGQLAGGVGHELRNPLGVISNAIYYLKMVLPDADETVKEYLETISSEVDRSTIIVSDLLDLSRSRPAEREVIDVSELINQALDRYSPPEEIEVVTEIPSDLSPLFVDPFQIGQVFNNLITNGYQAMPDGGKLTINAKAQEDKVYLSITDTGCGISKDNMKNIFEPLGKVAESHFNCILTDIKMPEMNGVDFYKMIKKEKPDIPVVMMTAYSADKLVKEGLEEGAIAVLTKPLDIEALLSFFSTLRKERSIVMVDDDPQFLRL